MGRDVSAAELRERHDAVVVAIGSRVHRDLAGARPRAAGRALRDGVPLPAQPLRGAPGGPPGARAGARASGSAPPAGAWWWWAAATPAWTASRTRCARARRTCCCSTSTRRCPTTGRPASTPWPLPPKRTPTTYALDEGGERRFGTADHRASPARTAASGPSRAGSVEGTSSRDLHAVPGSEFTEPADLVLIAIGFSHPEHEGAVEQLGVDLDARGNVKAPRLRDRASRACSPAATRAWASRWWSPRSPRGAAARAWSTASWAAPGETRNVPAVGAVRLRGRRPALAAPPGRDGPHGDGGRRLLVGPARGALGVAAIPAVDPARDHIRGAPDGRVTLVEYGDFQCPYCGDAYPVVQGAARRATTGCASCSATCRCPTCTRARRPRPRPPRRRRRRARFWDMHDRLFENQHALSDEELREHAAALGLDLERFDRELREGVHARARGGGPPRAAPPAASRARRGSSSTARSTSGSANERELTATGESRRSSG